MLLPPALETGRLELITHAMAREVTTDDEGLATGISYIDKNDGREHHVRASIVVLAASACESARLLLNSRSTRHENGLANENGAVGRYLMDSTGTDAVGYFPQLADGVPHNEDGASGMHLYIPWWRDNRELDFPRGYHIEFWGGRRMPRYGFLNGIEKTPLGGGYGQTLKDNYRKLYGATIGFSGRGEMIPNDDSYCEIDPDTVDRWGIPVLRFHFRWSEHEIRQVKHMHETFHELIEHLGGTPLTPMPTKEENYGILPGGRIIHEVGVTRMGNSAHVGVERVLPGARRQERFCHRRRSARLEPEQEPDVDHPRTRDAHQRLHCRRAAPGEHLMPSQVNLKASGARWFLVPSTIAPSADHGAHRRQGCPRFARRFAPWTPAPLRGPRNYGRWADGWAPDSGLSSTD